MTGPYYSVGPIKNVTLAASNISNFINQFRDVLLSCNWTLVSAFSGVDGTPGYIIRSYPTPNNLNKIRIKVFYDGDSATGFAYPTVRFMISDENGANEQLAGFVGIESNHGDKTVRCIAGPHQFFVFLDETVAPNSSYYSHINTVMGGCPHVRNATHGQVFWCHGEGNAAGRGSTFRYSSAGTILGGNDFSGFLINGFAPWTAAFPDTLGNTANIAPSLLAQRGANMQLVVPHWDGNWPITEALCMIGRVPNNCYAVNIWDAVMVGTRFPNTVYPVMDGRNWESFTRNTDTNVMGTLFLVTSVLVNPNIGGFSY